MLALCPSLCWIRPAAFGNFLRAGAQTFDSVTHLFGIDINGGHVEYARNHCAPRPTA